MSLSVNGNPGALIALQNLYTTAGALDVTQNRLSTGLAVATAKDNGAIWAIAQNQRSTSIALDSVKQSIQRVQSTIDVATAAGGSVSDLLNQLKATALSASDSSIDTNSRNALNETFTNLRDQVGKVVSNAVFGGTNLLKSGAVAIAALANDDGTSVLTVAAQDLSLGGANVTLTATASISTQTLASNALTAIDTSIVNTNNALAKLGSSSNALGAHLTFIGELQDSIDTGVGNLVNANLAKESANLQAEQSKQQLGLQALSIANSSSSALLGLFK